MWRQLGFPPERLGEVVAVSPTCGLAGASMEYARSALRAVRAAGRRLVEEPE
jgi:methionine synthase II (cobalamin-independent)